MNNQKNRGYVILGFMGLVIFTFVLRLLYIQVLSDEYARKGANNVIKTKPVVPPRGGIYDRRGEVIVSNQPLFTMMITPRELVIEDTSVLVRELGMTPTEIEAGIAKAQRYSYFKESILARYIEPETYGRLQEQMWKFKGISFGTTNKRYYHQSVGANLLGYISEVGPKEIELSQAAGEGEGGWYEAGDQIGKSGIERYYEDTLRGKKGYRKVLHDKYNREVGPYADRRYDEPAIKGKDIMLGIDVGLQAFGEELMRNKKGSIVALDPGTGEILAFVSAPSYDPNMLTGRELRRNWRRLRSDTLNPLFNRPLMAHYSPGSIFKLPLALVGLSEGVLQTDTRYRCGGGWWRNRGKPGCHAHASPLDLGNAIRYSCNAYFAEAYFSLLHDDQYENFYEGYNTWYQYMQEFGFGRELGVDLPYEEAGMIPTAARYDQWYGENRWVATTIISNAIGQGEVLLTPLQMANMTAMIANRGYYRVPHFVRAVRSAETDTIWQSLPYPVQRSSIARRHFEPVVEAMEKVVESGTARRAYLRKYAVCGKTGTVENSHGKDHSVFIGFAPRDNPRIAVAAIVENAGFGGTWAAPTVACMIEKYLNGEIDEKAWEYQRLLNANFIDP